MTMTDTDGIVRIKMLFKFYLYVLYFAEMEEFAKVHVAPVILFQVQLHRTFQNLHIWSTSIGYNQVTL